MKAVFRSFALAGLAALIGAPALAQAPAASAPPPAPPRAFAPPPPEPAPAPGQPVESRPPNAAWQKPAFPNQTRAPYTPSNMRFTVETVAEGLEYPWGLAFLPDGRMIVTERKGRIRIVSGHELSPPVEGLPPIHLQAVSGLLDIAVDPRFPANHLIYFSFVEPRGNDSTTSVARAKLIDGPQPRLEDLTVIYRAEPAVTDLHSSFGGRLLFAPDGTLFVSLGDRDADQWRPLVQRMDTSIGKLVHIRTDGSIPPDNPFVGQAGARPEIWAIGFRNPLGLAFRPGTGELWLTDVGPRGGDELNLIKKGLNYGWPIVTYGEEYNGKPVGEGVTARAGYEQPVYYWDPVISPSSLLFYDGAMFPAWRGSAFVTSLTQRHLNRLVLNGDRVVGEERLLTDPAERLREVKQAPDGSLLILTDAAQGRILRLAPAG